MPNITKNVIKIFAGGKTTREVLEEMKEKKILGEAGPKRFWIWDFDFNAIIPIPEALLKTETSEEEDAAHQICTEKWGTESIPWEISINFSTGEIVFLTTGGAPIPIIQALPEIIPNISFVWVCAGREDVCCKRYVCRNGQIVSVEEPANGSPVAYEMYIGCWGIDDCMHQENGSWVKHNCGNYPNPCQL